MKSAIDAEAGVSIVDIVYPLDALTAYPNNARKHPQTQIDELAQRFRQFGFTNPLIVDENCMILSGHGRASAAAVAGLKAVPCRQVHGLTEAKKRAYVLWDNKSAMKASWDDDLLITELRDLRGLDVLDVTGFAQGEFDELDRGWQPNWEKVARKLDAATRGRIVVECKVEDAEALIEFLRAAIATANTFADVEIETK
ncbi:MAG: ParB/Srx family N-terminal domain-containing protein [Gammaproteobacteria bacterium]